MLRSLAFLLPVLGACANATAPAGAPEFTSVRDRLSQPTRLYIAPGTSTGAITASRYTSDGWVDGTTPLTVANGDLTAVLDHDGKLDVSQLLIAVDSIAIPDSVLGKPAELNDVKLTLAPQHSLANVVWQSDDDATLTLTLALDLSWRLGVGTDSASLATQHLPPVTVDVMLTGGGDHIDASLALDAQGELWSWAGLFKLTRLELALAAATQDVEL
jgi:hypothetical protein